MTDIDHDLEVDRLVAIHVMHGRPEILWAASQDGGKSMAMWTDNDITKSAVEQFCARYPQYQVVERKVWPRYTESIEMAWRVVERMRKRGFWMSLKSPFDADITDWHAGFTPHSVTGWNGRPDYCGSADTAPRVVSGRCVGCLFNQLQFWPCLFSVCRSFRLP